MRRHYPGGCMARYKKTSLRKEIGERLAELREEAGVSSQQALANLAGVDRSYVGRLERGETGVTVDMLVAILDAMHISLSEFFRPFTRRYRPRTPRRRE